MSLEEFTPDIDSSEWEWHSVEASKDSSEKYKESTKKAWAKVAKIGKDEKKAKKYDFLLAGFLVKIIVDKKYDSLLDTLFSSIHKWYPSNFVLWILSLINLEISNKIRETSKNESIHFDYNIKKEFETFDDNHMDPNIKDRINYWVEDIVDSVTIEYSDIQTQRLKDLLKSDEKILLTYSSKIFSFFLNEINIDISIKKSESISKFILSEVEKAVDKLEIEKL